MTRAEDYLHMIVPQRFFVYQQRGSGDRHMYAVRTRFIPNNILDHFEQYAWPPAARENGPTAAASPKVADIGTRLKKMWS
jgi:DNA helicase-2/ATP-dependent DNA helicase PcrA